MAKLGQSKATGIIVVLRPSEVLVMMPLRAKILHSASPEVQWSCQQILLKSSHGIEAEQVST